MSKQDIVRYSPSSLLGLYLRSQVAAAADHGGLVETWEDEEGYCHAAQAWLGMAD